MCIEQFEVKNFIEKIVDYQSLKGLHTFWPLEATEMKEQFIFVAQSWTY